MEKDIQHLSVEMDQKAYSFLQLQRDYYMNKADDMMLMEQTTQPFWQSMRLGKRRLISKGLSMDVDISRDSKSRTIKDESLHIRKDGHHFVGNKARNVRVQRCFYKDGRKLATIKNREICQLSLLKTEVDGDKAACPNCGYVNTIASFIDGCDACDAKFTVKDFEAKLSGFSLEENTNAKIADTVYGNAMSLVRLLVGFILLGIIAFVMAAIRLTGTNTDIQIVGPIMGISMAIIMVPVVVRSLIILIIAFATGTFYLLSIYKEPILQEAVVKKYLPHFSATDFYQNLEYKLKNIHLTDKVSEVSVFARCSLQEFIEDYRNVVECDMNRLKFLAIDKMEGGYRVRVKAEMRLTESKGKRILSKYEVLNLTLFGRPEIIDKPAIALREYKCPSCGSSINVLEGGRCSACDRTFDYSEFGWVIESYGSKRKKISLYQTIKYIMRVLFVLVFGCNILFPVGFGRENIFQMYDVFSKQAAYIERMYNDLERPDTLYDDVILVSDEDYYIQRRFEYETENADLIMKEYRTYLEEQDFEVCEESENAVILRMTFDFQELGVQGINYYEITITKDGSAIIVEENLED